MLHLKLFLTFSMSCYFLTALYSKQCALPWTAVHIYPHPVSVVNHTMFHYTHYSLHILSVHRLGCALYHLMSPGSHMVLCRGSDHADISSISCALNQSCSGMLSLWNDQISNIASTTFCSSSLSPA